MPEALERPLSALDVIFTRRSVRAYTPYKLDRSTVLALLDAAVQAPTAMHAEPWLFVVIQDEETLKRYSDIAKTTWIDEMDTQLELHRPRDVDREQFLTQLRDPGFSLFYDAGTLIVVYGRTKGPFVIADCWLAAENLMLAACAAGLGTCVTGLAVPALNTPEWKKILNVQDEMTAYAPVLVGYPATLPPPPSRNPPELLCWM